MDKKRVGVDMPIELYNRLYSFAENTYDPMTRVIIKAIDTYIRTNSTLTGIAAIGHTPQINLTIPEPLTFNKTIQKKEATPEEIEKILEKYKLNTEGYKFYEKNKQYFDEDQKKEIIKLIDSLQQESLDYINKNFPKEMKASSDMNGGRIPSIDFIEDWFKGYQEPSDWKYISQQPTEDNTSFGEKTINQYFENNFVMDQYLSDEEKLELKNQYIEKINEIHDSEYKTIERLLSTTLNDGKKNFDGKYYSIDFLSWLLEQKDWRCK